MDNPGNCHSLIESMYFILMALTHETPSVSIPAASPRHYTHYSVRRSFATRDEAGPLDARDRARPSNHPVLGWGQLWAYGVINFKGGVPLPIKRHVPKPATELGLRIWGRQFRWWRTFAHQTSCSETRDRAGPSGRPVPKNLKMNFGGVGVLPPGAGMELGGAWSRKVGLVGGSMASTRSNFID